MNSRTPGNLWPNSRYSLPVMYGKSGAMLPTRNADQTRFNRRNGNAAAACDRVNGILAQRANGRVVTVSGTRIGVAGSPAWRRSSRMEQLQPLLLASIAECCG